MLTAASAAAMLLRTGGGDAGFHRAPVAAVMLCS
jgi:hypothetical protein